MIDVERLHDEFNNLLAKVAKLNDVTLRGGSHYCDYVRRRRGEEKVGRRINFLKSCMTYIFSHCQLLI